MFPKFMTFATLAALLLSVIVQRMSPQYLLLPQLMIFLGAGIVFLQAIHQKQYGWAMIFLSVAIFFNPLLVIVPIDENQFAMLTVICFTAVAFAFTKLKNPPLLSIESITDRNPGSESL